MDTLSTKLGLDFLRAPWLPEVFLIVLVVTAVNLLAYYLFRRAERGALKTENVWDDAFVQSAARPVQAIIWLVGITYAAEVIGKHSAAPVFEALGVLRNVGVVASLAWFMVGFIGCATNNLVAQREKAGEEVDRTTMDAISKLARLVVLVTALLVVLQSLGISISGILAAGGIGGIAIGFAAKDLLANFFGGLTIYLDRPFSVGDWIRSPDKDIEGTVEFISWRHTRVRRFNKNPLYVPNALFTTIAVENPSRMSHRRIKEVIGVRYDDINVVAPIVADIKQMLLNHPEIDASQPLIVNFNAFGPSSLDIFIYTFTRTTVWTHFHEVKQDVLLKIAGIIAGHGASIAFPTRTLLLDRDTQRALHVALPEKSGSLG